MRLFGIVKLGDAMSDGSEIPDKPDPKYWRDRAEATRANAERITNPRAKRMMLGSAAGYERLADRIEQRRLKAKKKARRL